MHNFKDILFIGQLIVHWTYAVEYNIALNKAVITSNNLPDHPANMVIDRDLNTYVQVDYVNDGKNVYPWLQFDLKGVYNITKIIFWPNNDDYDYWTARIYAFVRLTNDTAYNNDVYCYYSGPDKGVAFNCSKTDVVQGRYVLLKKESGFRTETLKIAEVAILSEDIAFLVPMTGPVEQSHVFIALPYYNASKAIDGDLSTCIHTAQEADVNRNIAGWWRTDLGDIYLVVAVYINDFNALASSYRGDYLVYVDSGGFSKQQLCLFFNQSSYQFTSFFLLTCVSALTGRYLTVERISSAFQPDALNFCELQVVAIHKDSVYTLPINYNGVSTTPTTPTLITLTTTATTTIKTQVPYSPTSPLTTSSTTKELLTFTNAISTADLLETCSNNCSSCEQREKLIEMEKLMSSCQKKETEKIVIGVVVGLLTAIIFIILGFVCGYMYHKKKNVKPMEPIIYEKTKEENTDQHVYSDLNNTPMKEINTYYNENK